MSLLANKIVVITGSSRGIGRACAVKSAEHGAQGLVLHYLGDSETETEIGTLTTEISRVSSVTKTVTVPGDIADSSTSRNVVDAAVHHFGRIG
jgi:L-rhamnose 1-dehydrogenase